MVALHNKKLSDRDLFRGVLWTDAQWHARKDIYRTQVLAMDVRPFEVEFRISNMMMAYQQQQPSMKDRQKILARIYPHIQKEEPAQLTDDEMAWLIDRLAGVNDPIGMNIVLKLTQMTEPAPQ